MRSLVFFTLAALACASPLAPSRHDVASAQATPNVTVRPDRIFQTWRGWEVANVNPADPAFKYSAALTDTVLGYATDQFHITRIRLQAVMNNIETQAAPTGNPDSPYLWANDNADPTDVNSSGFRWVEFDQLVQNWVLPMKKRVGADFLLNLNVVCMTTSCKSAASNPAEYAEFVRVVVDHLQSTFGLTPDYVELMLEPTLTAAQLGKDLAALRMSASLAGIKIIGPSLVGAVPTTSYSKTMQAQPGAGFMDELSYHRYSTAPSADTLKAIRRYALTFGAETSMLEHIGANQTELWQDLTLSCVSAWQRYTLAGPSSTATKQGKLLFVDNGVITVEPSANYLWQFMHFISPGDVRVGASVSTSLLKAVAFQRPSGDVAVVVITSGKINVNIGGLPAGTYDYYWTTAGVKRKLGGTKTIVAGNVLVVPMPAAGVLTAVAR